MNWKPSVHRGGGGCGCKAWSILLAVSAATFGVVELRDNPQLKAPTHRTPVAAPVPAQR